MKKQVLILAFLLAGALGALACTSAIISGSKTASGRPLLWKHRDTGCPDNRVELIKAHDNCYEFVAIFDATDPCDTAAWTGFNETGFAIMNTASYNLNNDDMEGESLLSSIDFDTDSKKAIVKKVKKAMEPILRQATTASRDSTLKTLPMECSRAPTIPIAVTPMREWAM